MITSTPRIPMTTAAGQAVRFAVLAATLTGTAHAGSALTASTHHHSGSAHARHAHRKQPQHSVRLSCDRRNSWLQNLLADKQCVDRAMADDGKAAHSNELPVLYRGDAHQLFESGAFSGMLTPGATHVTFSGEIAL
jgi:hypothetical protein